MTVICLIQNDEILGEVFELSKNKSSLSKKNPLKSNGLLTMSLSQNFSSHHQDWFVAQINHILPNLIRFDDVKLKKT
jgi:hypothetical protein